MLRLSPRSRTAGLSTHASISPQPFPCRRLRPGRLAPRASARTGAPPPPVASVALEADARIRTQALKDAELVASGKVRGVVWHFYQGATQELLDLLRKTAFSMWCINEFCVL